MRTALDAFRERWGVPRLDRDLQSPQILARKTHAPPRGERRRGHSRAEGEFPSVLLASRLRLEIGIGCRHSALTIRFVTAFIDQLFAEILRLPEELSVPPLLRRLVVRPTRSDPCFLALSGVFVPQLTVPTLRLVTRVLGLPLIPDESFPRHASRPRPFRSHGEGRCSGLSCPT